MLTMASSHEVCPKTAKPLSLVILGEAPGADEEATGLPFVGASGHLLRTDLLPTAGLSDASFTILNTFPTRPPNNDLSQWTITKTDAKRQGLRWEELGPPIAKRFLRPEHHAAIRHTWAVLDALAPDYIIAMGSTALWLLTGDSGIGKHRGTFFPTPWGKAIATYHPAAVLRQYAMRPIVWADLRKVRLDIDGLLAPPLRRELWINPTFAEIEAVYWRMARLPADTPIGVDIETAQRTITMISFATPELGICIPIWNKDAAPGTDPNYWPNAADEVKAWRLIRRFAQLRHPKVLQNGTYDMQYLLEAPLPIRLVGSGNDTSLLHHSLQPELRKDLGTLASLYLNEPSWKFMRTDKKGEVKADA